MRSLAFGAAVGMPRRSRVCWKWMEAVEAVEADGVACFRMMAISVNVAHDLPGKKGDGTAGQRTKRREADGPRDSQLLADEAAWRRRWGG